MNTKQSTRTTKNSNKDDAPTDESKKRLRSPETKSLENETAKKSKTVKLSASEMDEFRNLIESSTKSIEEKIKETHVALENKFDALAVKVNNDVQSLKSSVDEFKNGVSNEFAEIRTQIVGNTQRIENTEDDIQRLTRSQDLRLIGIPPIENENLLDYVNIIATEIGCATFTSFNAPPMERILLINRSTKQATPSNTILIHFIIPRQKQIFYSHYLNKMPLNPEKFGLSQDKRITLSENLTRKNTLVFKQALLLRKDRKIAQTFTEDGLVKIRFVRGKKETQHIVRSITELETAVERYSVSLQPNANAPASGQSNEDNNEQHSLNTPTPMDQTSSDSSEITANNT